MAPNGLDPLEAEASTHEWQMGGREERLTAAEDHSVNQQGMFV